MSFLNPLLLSTLAAISIPIILHILYKRQVIRIDFSSIRFLKELQKNQLVKTSWLEIIILLLRILTIACLVIAFSNPVTNINLPFSMPLKSSQFIYIDTHDALRLNKDGVSLQQQLIETVRQFISGLNSEDELYWIDPVNLEIESISASDLISRIIDLNSFHTDSVPQKKISEAVQFFAEEQRIDSYSTYVFTAQSIDTKSDNPRIFNIADNYDYKNAFVRSAEFSSQIRLPDYSLEILIHFAIPKQIPTFAYTVIIDQKTIYEDEIETNESAVRVPIASYKNGVHSGEIRLSVADDYRFDNRYFFTFRIADRQKILVLSDDDQSAVNHYFSQFPDSNLQVTRSKAIESLSHEWTNYDYVFFNGQMPTQSVINQMLRYTENGSGTLILIPVSDFDFESWNRTTLKSLVEFKDHFSTENGVDQFILNARDFRNSISYSFSDKSQSESVSLNDGYRINLRNQEILIGNQHLQLLVYNRNKRVYTFLNPLKQTSTNFVTDSRFVPVMYSLLFTELLDNRYYPDRGEAAVFSKTYEAQLNISGENKYSLTAIRRLNNQTIYSLPDRVQSGNYSYEIDQRNHILAVNKKALNLDLLSTEQKEFVSSWTTFSGETGNSAWRLFLILALFFYLAELWLGKAAYKTK